MDRILLACQDYNFDEALELASERGLDLEIQTFAFPEYLDSGVEARVASYRDKLRDFSGKIAIHGAFMDMSNASFDPRIVAVARQRYLENLDLAAEFGAHTVVFHANFLTQIRALPFRRAWTERQVAFWVPMVEEAAARGVRIALENMWEYDPDIIGDVLRRVNSEWLVACLDVGHVHLFSEVPFRDWLASLGKLIQHTHLNNNGGQIDEHRGFDDGVLDYHSIMPMLRELPGNPVFALEMDSVSAMRSSLPYFDIAPVAQSTDA